MLAPHVKPCGAPWSSQLNLTARKHQEADSGDLQLAGRAARRRGGSAGGMQSKERRTFALVPEDASRGTDHFAKVGSYVQTLRVMRVAPL